MIKVITLNSGAWDSCIRKISEENIDKNECASAWASGSFAWESSILNQFINEGWDIKDFKVTDYNGRIWTFILEKPMFS